MIMMIILTQSSLSAISTTSFSFSHYTLCLSSPKVAMALEDQVFNSPLGIREGLQHRDTWTKLGAAGYSFDSSEIGTLKRRTTLESILPTPDPALMKHVVKDEEEDGTWLEKVKEKQFNRWKEHLDVMKEEYFDGGDDDDDDDGGGGGGGSEREKREKDEEEEGEGEGEMTLEEWTLMCKTSVPRFVESEQDQILLDKVEADYKLKVAYLKEQHSRNKSPKKS